MGWDKAQVDRQRSEEELRERHRAFVESERRLADAKIEEQRKVHENEIQRLEEQYNSMIGQRDAAFEIRCNELSKVNDEEIAELRQHYANRAKQNDKLREDAIRQCELLRTSYRRSEDYWRNQILKLNDFLAAAMAVVRTVSERYEWLQGNISKVAVGSDMVKGLHESYEALVKDAHKHAPPIIGDEAFKK